MSWNSWSEFWTMGGYALYVWGSVGAVFAVLAVEVLGLVWQRQAVIAEVAQARHQRRSVRQQRAATGKGTGP